MKSHAAATDSSVRPLAFMAWRSIRVMMVMLSIDWSPLYRALKWLRQSFFALMRFAKYPA